MSIAACTPTPIRPGIVVFNPAAFAARYPAFATFRGIGSITADVMTITRVLFGVLGVSDSIGGGNIPAGVTITALGTGTGGVGTYDVSSTPDAASQGLTGLNVMQAENLQQCFNQAELLLNNGCCSVVRDAPTRQILLNLLVAHIAALLLGINGQPPQGVVGRVSSASEGSVSVSAQYASTVSEGLAYYSQTPWGAQFWQATAKYRTARYLAPCDVGGPFPWDAWPQ